MHLEDADFVCRAEPVFHGAQDAELVAAFALEIEDRIDHVFHHARAGNVAFLGNVTNEDQRRAGFLGPAGQLLRAGANLAD